MDDLDKRIEEKIDTAVLKIVFGEWQYVSNRCGNLNGIIQNGLDIIEEDDLKAWMAAAKRFEEDYKALKKRTYKIVKEHLEGKHGKEGHTVRQDGEDC